MERLDKQVNAAAGAATGKSRGTMAMPGNGISRGVAHVAGAGAARDIVRLPTSGIPRFDGIDDLRRLVQGTPRVLDDMEQVRVSDLVDELYAVEPSMPFGYRSLDLGHALATVDRIDPKHVREGEQVRAAWNLRFGTDPTDQAAIGARINELLDGAPTTVDSQRGIAELRTLLHMSTDDSLLPTELGIAVRDKLDDELSSKLAGPLARTGSIGDAGAALLDGWRLVRDPDRLAAWQSTVDDAARGRGELPADATIELVLAPASRFGARSLDQRMRLLDALASAGDGPLTTAASRTRNDRSIVGMLSADVQLHQGRQVGRALKGDHPLPLGIHTWDILNSWHYKRAPFADRVALLERHGRQSGQKLFEQYGDMRDRLDPAAIEVGRRQVERLMHDSLRTGEQLPEWVGVGDVVLAPITGPQKATLLEHFRSQAFDDSPEGAAAWMVNARLRLNAEQLGGDVDGAVALRRSTLDLIDRNLHRIAGDVEDGYGGHPDYADVGRAKSNLNLLEDFTVATQARRDEAAADVASAASGSTVTW